jgi:hypothetical protein
MAAPPSLDGAVQVRELWASPSPDATPVGLPGVVLGITEAVADVLPVPAALTAAARNAYEVPLVRPVTV